PSEATTATTVTIISNTHLPWPHDAIKHAIRKRHLAEEGAHGPAFEALSKHIVNQLKKSTNELQQAKGHDGNFF
nr:hypothetical protein [Tanacetum cinerariifolium]